MNNNKLDKATNDIYCGGCGSKLDFDIKKNSIYKLGWFIKGTR